MHVCCHGNVQWTAFFSDVEHEVEEVLLGHRVTLTFNLYADPEPRHEARVSLETATDEDEEEAEEPPPPPPQPMRLEGLDLQSVALYQELIKALANSTWLPQGGRLGFGACYAAH